MLSIEWPSVSIVICTYDRYDEILRTVQSLRLHLKYPESKLKWIIADDASPSNYRERLSRSEILAGLDVQFTSPDKNSGWAGNVNLALSQVETEFIYFTEDDYVLTRPLDLTIGVSILEVKPDIGMLRYRGISGEHMVLHQFEADISDRLSSFQQGLGLPGRVSYLQIDSGSPSLYIYSNGPHLKRRHFHEFYGVYPTGLRLGHTEESFAHVVKDLMTSPEAPAIAILPEWVPMWFDHIGQSYQHTEKDK